MSQPRSRGRAALRHLAAPALALAVVAALPMAGGARPAPANASDPTLAPVSVSYSTPLGSPVKGNFLSYNDFHGAIDPPTTRLGTTRPWISHVSSTAAAIARAASSISTAPPACGGVKRFRTRAAGSTTRSPRIST